MRIHFFLPALFVSLGLTLGAAPVYANKVTERSKQKQTAESERAELRKKLAALKREIGQTETARGHAADALADSEAAISKTNRALHQLTQEQRNVERRLADLVDEERRLTESVATQRAQLSTLLREQYVGGNEDRLKLILSGDNPNRINRDMQYLGYVSQAQARMIASLQADLAKVEENRAKVENAHAELQEIGQEQLANKKKLEQEKARHNALLAQLSQKLSAQRKEAGNIERDQKRLSDLVERLARLMEEQRKAEAAAREKRRQEQLAAARAKQEQAAKSSGRNTQSGRSSENERSRERILGRNTQTPDAGAQGVAPGTNFASLRGKLRLPVQGEIIASYGAARRDGPNWKGLFIRATEGADVKAVASGEVVFADWLRGFGNLLIIDHGNQYMTIYGNNQAVLKHVGDKITTGDTIATAGSSGGNEQSGLYFEMRHAGQTFDPMRWISAGSIK